MDIKNFFKPTEITREIEISDRFCDENGEICKFLIKSLSEIENEDIKKLCFDVNGNFDAQKYLAKLVCKSVIKPNLASSELQALYGVLGQEKLLKTMLLSGEYAFLCSKVQEICGFTQNFFENVDFLKN